MRPRLLLTINWKFAVDFFARGLHTRTTVARLPLRQLGFLVTSAEEVVFVAVFVLSYLCAKYLKKSYERILMKFLEGGAWPKDQSIRSSWRSGLRSRSRNFYRILYLGLHVLLRFL